MIPKIIHYCWFGSAPMTELGRKCIESWKKFCPDYEIRLWNEQNVALDSVPYMREAYEEKAYGFVPDVARLQIIYEHGGIYLDTDVELIRPLDELLDKPAFMGQEDNKFVALGLGFGAEKGNPVIKMMLDDYQNRHFRLENGELDRTPAPRIQMNVLERLGYRPGPSVQTLEGAVIYPAEYFCPQSFYSGITTVTERTFSIHHYEGAWLSSEERKKVADSQRCIQKYGPILGGYILISRSFREQVKSEGFWRACRWAGEKAAGKLRRRVRR